MSIRFHKGDLPDDADFGDCVAIDTETLRLVPHRDRLCVVQLSRGDGSASAGSTLITAASQQRDESVQKGSLIIHDEDGAPSLVVHVVPLCRRSAGKESPVAGLVIVDCQRVLAERINAFVDLFVLTPGEARVVAQLISGKGLTKAASRLNIAPPRRDHILHIFWKRLAHTARRGLSAFFTK